MTFKNMKGECNVTVSTLKLGISHLCGISPSLGTGNHSMLEDINGAKSCVRMFLSRVWSAWDQKEGFQRGQGTSREKERDQGSQTQKPRLQ